MKKISSLLACDLCIFFIFFINPQNVFCKEPPPKKMASPTPIISGSVTYFFDSNVQESQFHGADLGIFLKKAKDPEWSGIFYPRYFVEVANSKDVTGSAFRIFFRPRGSTIKDALDEGIRSKWRSIRLGKAEDNDWFAGVYGKYLLVDQGCCPEPRGLQIYDLETGADVFHDSYSSPVSISNGILTFWESTGERAKPETCPDFKKFSEYGGFPEMDELVEFDFKNLNLHHSGNKRCAPRQ